MKKNLENLLFRVLDNSQCHYDHEEDGNFFISLHSMEDSLNVKITQDDDNPHIDVRVKVGKSAYSSTLASRYHTRVPRSCVANFLTLFFLKHEQNENANFIELHGNKEFESIKNQVLKILGNKPSEHFEFLGVKEIEREDDPYTITIRNKARDENCSLVIQNFRVNDLRPLEVRFCGTVQSQDTNVSYSHVNLFLEAHTLGHYPLIMQRKVNAIAPLEMIDNLLSANDALDQPSKILQKFKLDNLLEEKNDDHGPRVKI